MTTLGDLQNSIASSLRSFTGVQEQSTYLTSAIGTDDTTLAVASSDQMMRGIIEIDDELLYVDVADANALAIPPYGRGYRGSTAATHSENTQVIFDPSFPKVEVTRAINECIAGLYPQLYRIQHTDLDYSVIEVGYDLPADCETVLEVKAQAPSDPFDYWMPLYNWSFDPTSPETDGKALNLMDAVQPGSTLRIVYMSKFGSFVNSDSTLASIGLPDSCSDLILYGVTARLVRFLDPARLQVATVENLSRAQVVAAGDAGKIANQLYAMYQQRLNEERRKLLELTPARIHFSR